MSKRKQYADNKPDPFDGETEFPELPATEADEALYGKIPPSENVIARPVDIFAIWPDLTQPRRILPSAVRAGWNGNPDDIGEILEAWHHLAESAIDVKVPVSLLLLGKVDAFRARLDAYDPLPFIFSNYIDLIELAASIHSIGLQNPIRVSREGDTHTIVQGERRWMAYHLLCHYFPGDASEPYTRIPATVSQLSGWDRVVAQADENQKRAPLNAIGTARQFALLLMEARRDIDGHDYQPFHQLVVDCDRPYYAQVKDGNNHPIPYGMGAIFERSMGISTGQMRQYRRLLSLTGDYGVDNAIWQRADDESWPEGWLRELAPDKDWDEAANRHYVNGLLDVVTRLEWGYNDLLQVAKNRYSVTLLSEDAPAAPPVTPPEPVTEFTEEAEKTNFFAAGDHVRSRNTGDTGLVTTVDVSKNRIMIVYDNPAIGHQWADMDAYEVIEEAEEVEETEGAEFRVGDKVIVKRSPDWFTGTIRYIKHGRYGVFNEQSESTHYYDADMLLPVPDKTGEFQIGDRVLVHMGHYKIPGTILGLMSGGQCIVKYDNGDSHPHRTTALSPLVEQPLDEPEMDEGAQYLDRRVQWQDKLGEVIGYMGYNTVRVQFDDGHSNVFNVDALSFLATPGTMQREPHDPFGRPLPDTPPSPFHEPELEPDGTMESQAESDYYLAEGEPLFEMIYWLQELSGALGKHELAEALDDLSLMHREEALSLRAAGAWDDLVVFLRDELQAMFKAVYAQVGDYIERIAADIEEDDDDS